MRTLASKKYWLTFGYYELENATDPNPPVDFERFATDVDNSGFTGIYCHTLGPFDHKSANGWPFVFTPGSGWNYNQINPKWIAKQKRFYSAFGSRGLDIGDSFIDQYVNDKPNHPFKGLFPSDDALYSSLALYDDGAFHHIRWQDISEPKLQFKFFVDTPNAKMMALYIDAKVDIIVDALKTYPHLRVGYKWANETSGGDRKVGDRSEMNAYLHERFAAKGFPVDGKRLISFVDREYISSHDSPNTLIAKRKSLHDSITRPYGVSWGLGAIHEIHKMCDDTAIRDRIDTQGADNLKTLFSNDGMACNKDFPKRAKSIIAMIKSGEIKFADIKMEESWVKMPYEQGKINTSWTTYAPAHLGLA